MDWGLFISAAAISYMAYRIGYMRGEDYGAKQACKSFTHGIEQMNKLLPEYVSDQDIESYGEGK